jgi:hypothetical protein
MKIMYFNHLKTKINMNHITVFSLYRAVSTLHHGCKNRLLLHKHIDASVGGT